MLYCSMLRPGVISLLEATISVLLLTFLSGSVPSEVVAWIGRLHPGLESDGNSHPDLEWKLVLSCPSRICGLMAVNLALKTLK